MEKRSHAIINHESRVEKANKIIKILSQELEDANALGSLSLLNVGTGSGHIDSILSKVFKTVSSVDVVDERVEQNGYKYTKVDDEILPFKNESFDVIISNHVIEHVNDPKMHIDEMYRVLKNDGLLYLVTPNKWWITDPHTKLPFISWMPKRLGSIYLRLLKNENWDVDPRGFYELSKYLENKFQYKNIAYKVVKNIEEYGYKKSIFTKISRILPTFVFRTFNYFLPNYIYICKKII